MASETTNYKLVKPNPEEFYDVEVQNSNMDKIDTALKELEDNKANNANLISLEQTVMSHLADSVKHVSQNEKDDWNNKLDKTGGTLTGNLAIHKGIPALIFGVPGRENDTRLFWNASTTNDFGLVFRVDGADALTLKSNKTIVDGNQRPVYTGTSVTVSQTPPQGTLANDAIHMVY